MIETGKVIQAKPVVKLTLMFGNICEIFQVFRYSPFFILFNDVKHVFQGDGEQVLLVVHVRVPHDLPEDIGFLVEGIPFCCFQEDL